MPASRIAAVAAVFFLTSAISVVTGSTSLITVPVMIAFGIEAHVAIATNMLALTFMSAGASLSFLGKGVIQRWRLPSLILLTLVGSAAGALLLPSIPLRFLQFLIGVAMIAVAIFSLFRPNAEYSNSASSPSKIVLGYATTLFLGVYGGVFSGGYVTLLTSALIFLFGMSTLRAIATTKVLNLFSSGVATAIFLSKGVVEVKLGLILGVAAFLGALIGARVALMLNAVWLRRLFVVGVLALAVRMLATY